MKHSRLACSIFIVLLLAVCPLCGCVQVTVLPDATVSPASETTPAPVAAPAQTRIPAAEPQYAAQAQYMPSQPAPAVEQPRYQEPAYAEPPRYQEPAYSEPPRQVRAQHPVADRYAVEEDPTATRQFARPVSRPMPAEEMEDAPRRRDSRVEEAPPKKKVPKVNKAPMPISSHCSLSTWRWMKDQVSSRAALTRRVSCQSA